MLHPYAIIVNKKHSLIISNFAINMILLTFIKKLTAEINNMCQTRGFPLNLRIRWIDCLHPSGIIRHNGWTFFHAFR